MVRKYERRVGSRDYQTKYSKAQLNDAVTLIKANKLSFKQAHKRFNIPVGTLWNKVHAKHEKKPGHPVVLSDQEEAAIVKYTVTTATWGFPLNRMDIRNYIRTYLNMAGKQVREFRNNTPSNFWVENFLSRHKNEITIRTCQNIKRSRAEVGADVIKSYFDNLEETIKDIPPQNIYNYDETNLSDNPGTKKCIFKRGIKYPERVQDSSKTAISVMFCGSATGVMIPAYVIYKSEHLWSTWCEGGPPGTRYGRTKSGWFDTFAFSDWFRTTFIPAVRNLEGPKLIIGDNLSSHFNPEVLRLATENDIKFCCLPPNSTHLCQPLDVAFYGPLKKYWRQVLDTWKLLLKRKSRNLTKEEFPGLLTKLYARLYPTEAETSRNLTAGFEKCGIYPFNPRKVLERLPEHQTAETTQDADELERVSSSALIKVLKGLRGVDGPAQPKRIRKKNSVEAGKSVCASDIQKSNILEEENEKETYREDQRENESSDQDESSSESSTESSNDELVIEVNLKNLVPDMFVLVKFQVKKIVQHFVGKIISIDQNEKLIEINFLRHSKKMKFKFFWPSVQDQGYIPYTEIEKILPSPTLDRRGAIVYKSKVLINFLKTLN